MSVAVDVLTILNGYGDEDERMMVTGVEKREAAGGGKGRNPSQLSPESSFVAPGESLGHGEIEWRREDLTALVEDEKRLPRYVGRDCFEPLSGREVDVYTVEAVGGGQPLALGQRLGVILKVQIGIRIWGK